MAQMKKVVTNKLILKTIVNLGERIVELPTKSEIDGRFDEVDRKFGEVLTELKATSRAVDADAVTVIKHNRRITRIEKHLNLT